MMIDGRLINKNRDNQFISSLKISYDPFVNSTEIRMTVLSIISERFLNYRYERMPSEE